MSGLTLKEYAQAEQNGISQVRLQQRIKRGWDREKAVTYPIGVRQTMDLDTVITAEQYKIAESNGINRLNLNQRVYAYGWDIEDAMTITTKGRGYKREAKYGKYIKMAEANGISYKTFHNRVNELGWTRERAATTPVMQKGSRTK